MIKVRGWQVSPAELESVLLLHPDIVDAAVIGVSLTYGQGEAPRAYIVQLPGAMLDVAKIKAHMMTYLARYKALDGGIVFTDTLPRNSTGKIVRSILKERAEREMKKWQIKELHALALAKQQSESENSSTEESGSAGDDVSGQSALYRYPTASSMASESDEPVRSALGKDEAAEEDDNDEDANEDEDQYEMEEGGAHGDEFKDKDGDGNTEKDSELNNMGHASTKTSNNSVKNEQQVWEVYQHEKASAIREGEEEGKDDTEDDKPTGKDCSSGADYESNNKNGKAEHLSHAPSKKYKRGEKNCTTAKPFKETTIPTLDASLNIVTAHEFFQQLPLRPPSNHAVPDPDLNPKSSTTRASNTLQHLPHSAAAPPHFDYERFMIKKLEEGDAVSLSIVEEVDEGDDEKDEDEEEEEVEEEEEENGERLITDD